MKANAALHPASAHVHVLSLGYDKGLLHDAAGKPASDGANRRMFFAERIGSYTMISLSPVDDSFQEKRERNIHVIPAQSRSTPLAMWRMYREGAKLCRGGRINVIQTQEPSTTGLVGQLLKFRFGIPVCVCVYGPNPWDEHWCRASWYNRLVTPLARYVLKHADRIIADGTITIERLAQAGIARERLTRKVNVPSNIGDFGHSDFAELRQQLLGNRFAHVLLHVSNLSIQKNIPCLLNAFQQIVHQRPETRLVVIGRGRRQPEYRSLADRLGLQDHILWQGSVPHNEIPAWFQAADVCLVTSRFEGFPRVFVESAAAGTPLVTTLVSGCNDGVIDGQNGFIVAQDDPAGLVARTIELLDDPGLRREMGERGRHLVQELAEKQELYNLLQVRVWAEILSQPPADVEEASTSCGKIDDAQA